MCFTFYVFEGTEAKMNSSLPVIGLKNPLSILLLTDATYYDNNRQKQNNNKQHVFLPMRLKVPWPK
jgi:hypothetical protein